MNNNQTKQYEDKRRPSPLVGGPQIEKGEGSDMQVTEGSSTLHEFFSKEEGVEMGTYLA